MGPKQRSEQQQQLLRRKDRKCMKISFLWVLFLGNGLAPIYFYDFISNFLCTQVADHCFHSNCVSSFLSHQSANRVPLILCGSNMYDHRYHFNELPIPLVKNVSLYDSILMGSNNEPNAFFQQLFFFRISPIVSV